MTSTPEARAEAEAEGPSALSRTAQPLEARASATRGTDVLGSSDDRSDDRRGRRWDDAQGPAAPPEGEQRPGLRTARRLVALTAAALAAPDLAAAVDVVLDAALVELPAERVRVELAHPVEGFSGASRAGGAAPGRGPRGGLRSVGSVAVGRTAPPPPPRDRSYALSTAEDDARDGGRSGRLVVSTAAGSGPGPDAEVAGALAALLGALVRAASAREASGRSAVWAAALEEVRRRALDGAAADRVVADLVERLPSLAGARAAFVVVEPGAAHHLGLGPPARAGTGPVDLGSTAVTSPVLAAVRTARHPVVVDLSGTPARPASTAWGPAVAAPLRVSPAARCALVVVRPAGAAAFEPPVLAELAVAADVLSVLLRAAVGRSDAQRLAVLAERERIAGELHRLVLQRLFAVGVRLQELRQHPAGPDQDERLQRAVAEVDASLRDVRSAVFGPPAPGERRTAGGSAGPGGR